jgi:hypothetical protein
MIQFVRQEEADVADRIGHRQPEEVHDHPPAAETAGRAAAPGIGMKQDQRRGVVTSLT